MLYAFYGTDTEKTSAQAKKTVAGLLKKRPDASVFGFTPDTFSSAALDEYIGAAGLFEAKHIVRLDGVLGSTDHADALLERLPLMAEVEHIFVMREGALNAAQKKKIEKHAQETKAYDVPKKETERFNVFALTDAVGGRDKKRAWMLYRRALDEGLVPEEIHGTLWWQVKTLMRVAQGDTVGLKPFSVTNAERFLKNYTPEEVATLGRDLVRVYHEARRGNIDFETGLEKLLLSL